MMPTDTATTDTTTAFGFDKPWLTSYLMQLQGMPFIEQALGLWLAYQADEDGVIDDIDWDSLGEHAHVNPVHAQHVLRQSTTTLLSTGLIERQNRMLGKVHGKPLFRIHYDKK